MTNTYAARMRPNVHRFIFQALVIFSILTTNMCHAKSCEVIAQKMGKDLIESGEKKEGKKDLQIFTDQDNNKEFRLRLGEQFCIQLPENPTTGFLWIVLESSSPNIELSRKDFLPPKDSGIIGSGGTRVFIFKATKSGKAVLHLDLKQPWKKEEKYANSYSLNLLVE